MPVINPVSLKGSVVVITGASRGLGAAFAESLAAEGAKVVICARDKAGLASVCKSIEKKGCACSSYIVDVTSSKEVNSFVSKVIKAHGRIDVLVNNAGAVHKFSPVEKISEEEYARCMRTNVDSVFHFLKAAIQHMKKRNSGVVVNVSSGAGKRAHANLSVYAASKFAVEAFTQAVARELEQEGSAVGCIALCPSGINTGMRAAVFGKEDVGKQQSPDSVAAVLRDVLLGKVKVPNGGDVFIREGKVTEVRDNLG